MAWADDVRRLKVRTNAETPLDCRTARRFGAEGIGLCRTEHMFFDAARITAVRQMILAEDEKGRRAALEKLLPEQRGDFAEIFEIMAGLPVTIRLLDPPLHEFLPHEDSEFEEVAAATGVGVEKLKRRAAELHEFNPMLGHRGCRLGITYPEIYEMQARAIFEAAVDVTVKTGEAPIPEVMVPLVATRRELEIIKALIDRTAAAVFAEKGRSVEYLVGTMIELPRAALKAGEIAEVGEFFSFGTNDLTQTALACLARRCGPLPRRLCRAGHLREGSVRQPRCRGCRRTYPDGGGSRPRDPARYQARHLRRTWRRSGLDRLLRGHRPRLCLGLALPRADRAAGGSAGCTEGLR
jgi:pyruvate,orthophosphate dikinase